MTNKEIDNEVQKIQEAIEFAVIQKKGHAAVLIAYSGMVKLLGELVKRLPEQGSAP